ncbi:PsiF family protein [Cupriavidus sp. AU9028]|uniref:PsiF family protein n=1 Tax=Cupriavidus sp. AU9028 TaxID=2871157 RepID=UPI001C977730|nr:PsiF family protein [Cupriavidus sp. AU9028]MBY4896526.1 PsiF family protein [Cupriavidus sp. AU9028]
MKHTIATSLLLGTLLAANAFAQDSSGRGPGNDPEQRRRHCEVEAKMMPADEREVYIKQCVGRQVPAVENQRQIKLKECSRRAEGRKGDEREAFMKKCQAT